MKVSTSTVAAPLSEMALGAKVEVLKRSEIEILKLVCLCYDAYYVVAGLSHWSYAPHFVL